MNKSSKIYTKTGDKGKTSLIGGNRVLKYHIRIEAYGTVDELNSYIGLIRDHKIKKLYQDILIEIQYRLFDLESLLACENKNDLKKLPKIKEEDILLLEKEIDKMEHHRFLHCIHLLFPAEMNCFILSYCPLCLPQS